MGLRTALASIFRNPDDAEVAADRGVGIIPRSFLGALALIDPSTLTPMVPDNAGTRIAAIPETALAVPAVYRSVAMIAASVGGMRWASWQPDSNVLVARQPAILRRPDPFSAVRTTKVQLTTPTLLRGEAFAWLTAHSSVDGRPTVAIPLDNNEVHLSWNDNRTRAVYRWRGQELELNRDILHVKYLDVPGLLHGLGPIQMARVAIAGGVLADSMATSYYEDGGVVDTVLEHPTRMTSDEADIIRAQWVDNPRRVRVASNGMVAKPMRMSNSDAQFIEGRNFTVQDIARLFGIPAPKLNANQPGSSLQYRNQEGIATEYATDAVQPVTDALEAAFGLLIPSTQEVRFRFVDLLRADARTRYDVYETALTNQILTVNEVRDLENLPPRPDGGDVAWTPADELATVTAR